MLIHDTIDVAQPIEKVWEFFGDVPQVAACLPGATLDRDLGNDEYAGKVGIRMGPVRLAFDGTAKILRRDEASKTMVIDGSGAAQGGKGNAAMQLTARLQPAATGGTKVALEMDLQLSGAAAQYGRGMVQDVTKVLMGQFAATMQRRIQARERGETLDETGAAPASGLAIAVQAARMALTRVFRRFFLPYEPGHA